MPDMALLKSGTARAYVPPVRVPLSLPPVTADCRRPPPGTGTNAAYIEKASHVGKWAGAPCDEMVINTEWGNLHMARHHNRFDAAVDAASDNPGERRRGVSRHNALLSPVRCALLRPPDAPVPRQ